MDSFLSSTDTPIILAIAGGSCSGKTTLAGRLHDYFGANQCRIVRQDDYYFDIRERGGSPLVNFDIPEALDFDLLAANLAAFKRGDSVSLPNYDFTTHQRCTPSAPCPPPSVIIVEGILLLNQAELRPLFDHSVFVRCDTETRLARRLQRDTTERGRTETDVLRQFNEQVEPAHQTYVSPSKSYADVVIEQAEYIADTAQVVRDVAARLRPQAEPKTAAVG